MIKIYYCNECDRIFYFSTELDTTCRACGTQCFKIRATYPEYTSMNLEERAVYNKEQVANALKKRKRYPNYS